MIKPAFLIAFGSFLLGACSSLPADIAKQPGKVLIKGVDTAPLKVMIRTIDGGNILWVGNYKLGTEAWVKPGAHKVNVMCEFHNSWGNTLVPGNVEIVTKEGVLYELTGAQVADGRTCVVKVTQHT